VVNRIVRLVYRGRSPRNQKLRSQRASQTAARQPRDYPQSQHTSHQKRPICWHLLEPTSTRRSSLRHLTPHRSDRYESPVRPVSLGGSGERPTNVVRAGSRRGGARRVVLGSAGQLGRLQTSQRWRKNNMVGVGKVRERGRKVKYDKR
jgi:hypothetical protein